MSGSDLELKQEAGVIARLLSYLVLLFASVALFVSAIGIPTSRFEKLGAGAFPKIVFAAMALMSIVAVVDALRQISRHAYISFFAQAAAWTRRRYLVFIVLAAFTAYLFAIPFLGFSVASLVFLFGLQVILMPRRAKSILIAAVVAVVFSFGLNWLFAEVFNVFLPRGVF